ncbi:MAG: CPBP family intramembrane metalloprotease [Ruminococcus sp.]|nr:CPBP family intramembrane metalloprotease [Ruminococcus sp.]
MAENLSSDYYRAEIAALNDEIKLLTERLSSAEESSALDKYDPFGNPTDYKGFGGDYSAVNPKIVQPGYTLPLEPGLTERTNLQRSCSIGGFSVILQFLLSQGLVMLLSSLVFWIMQKNEPGTSAVEIQNYISSSSIMPAITAIVFVFANLVSAHVGLRRAKIRRSLLLRPADFRLNDGFQYGLIGIFIWTVCSYVIQGTGYAAKALGVVISSGSDVMSLTDGKRFAIMAVYSCLLAPVTEELFFRGLLLRVFGKADQRFAVFASALFFGLIHGNIPQFILCFTMGIFLGHITLRHGSFIPAAMVHIIVNITGTVVGVINTDFPGISYAAKMTVIVLSVLGLLLLLIFRISDKLPIPTPHQKKRGFGAAGGSVTYAVSLLLLMAFTGYSLVRMNM